MSKRSLKLAAAGAILALAMMVPSAFALGGIELERDCSNGLGLLDTTQCSFNVADPSGFLGAEQEGKTFNVAVPIQAMEQVQINKQEGKIELDQDAHQGFQIPIAAAVAISGESKAFGHEADVDVFAPQYADAGVYGDMEVESHTGSADIEHSGNGDTTAIGGNTGNFQVAKPEIKGEDAFAVAADAKSIGGDGGDAEGALGGSNFLSGNGGWAIDATLGAPESEGGNGGSDSAAATGTGGAGGIPAGTGGAGNATASNSGDNSSGGAAGTADVTGASATAGNGSSTAGNAGTNTAGAGGAAGTAQNISLAKNVGDNATATATNTATSGASTIGDTNGNFIEGGNTGYNVTKGVQVGGSAANVLGVAVTQSGNVSSTSGTATQNGSPSASSSNTINQCPTPSVSLNNNPNQQGWNNGGVTQTSTSTQTLTPSQTVSSGAQTASGGATGSGVSVSLDD